MLENFTKRGISMILALVMVLSVVPYSAFAAEADDTIAEEAVVEQTPEAITEAVEDSADQMDRIRDAAARVNAMLKAEPEAEQETEPETEPETTPAIVRKNKKNAAAAVTEDHEHVAAVSEKVFPKCETEGMQLGTYCSVCGITLSGREIIPALGHDMEPYEGKLPTYQSAGWEPYEECSRCIYNTRVEIPKLELPAIEDFDTFLINAMFLEELANLYVLENPGLDPLNLMIKYIRTGVDRYNDGSWGIMAGYENADFAKFVVECEEMLNAEASCVEEMFAFTSLKDIKCFELPNGDYTDIGHMFGTMDMTYHNNYSQNHADVGGWVGDLVNLLEFADYGGVSGTLEEMVAEIRADYLLGYPDDSEVGSFSETDMYGDLDALYLMDYFQKNGYEYEFEVSGLAVLMMGYFYGDLSMETRAAYLLNNRLDGVSTRNAVREAVYNVYTTNKMITTLENTEDFATDDLETLRKAVCYAFADYICELAGDYVEVGENSLFTVFSTENTNLAPGINQQINMATNANGKQIVYYLATADITRDDVNLYANYHNNDPTQGWEMQRVMEQAYAAEQRHTDPDSELYIENYNVVAAVNGAGFNMGTGEPSGVLVMEGVEYHPIDSAGFVGILKDGTPVIGTKEEYNTIYKGQVKEAIACFGSRLIKDGKIVEGLTDELASRTAIGFTKTGKVVLLVLDGRQETFSAGGGYATLAQIMLEAGCVDATNLDGGGSSTFVAQLPGDEELSVVNRPSDGYARSVSTSWMLVSTAPSSTTFDHADLDSAVKYLTPGASTQITAVGISPSGNAVELPEGTTWAVSNETIGSISETGMFTATAAGEVNVYLMLDDVVVGSRTLTVTQPDNIYFVKANLDTVYGAASELPVKLLYQGKEMAFTANDIVFTLSNKKAGKIDGLSFTAISDENSGITNTAIYAALANNTSVSATLRVAIYKQGELTFDFEQATGGDRQFAWYREITNAVTDDGNKYTVVDPAEKMAASYILAIDMTHIPIPGNLSELTYMLPGSDIEGANAWTFLCQLAERISAMTEITAEVKYDPNFELDISELKIINDYFKLTETVHDEENCTLKLTLKWIKQTQAIDANAANPMCIVNGLKLIPKDDAQWNANGQLTNILSGTIGYTIYMRASALYSFASKPENQEYFELYNYINPDDSYDKGGYFSDIYTEFNDSYTLVNQLKQGWHQEDAGFAYYVNGNKLTGVREVEGLYYNFGENGLTPTKTPYSGLFKLDGNSYYAKNGELINGWQAVGNDWYLFDWTTNIGKEGSLNITINGINVPYEFEGGKVVKGYWYNDGVGLQYFYGPYYYKEGWREIAGKQYFFDEYYAATGIYPVRASHDIYPIWCEFDENGALIGDAPDGMHWFDGKLYYVKDTSSQFKGLLCVNGDYYYAQWDGALITNQTYWVSDSSGLLPAGSYRFGADGKVVMSTGLIEENGELYYYQNGKRAGGAGLVEIDGDFYFIDGSAKAVRDVTVWVSKTNGLWPAGNYTFGSDCKMIIHNGIVDGRYYVDGIGVAAGLVCVDGAYYYAGYAGKLTVSTICWISNTNDLLPAGTYRFGDDGKILMATEVADEDGVLYYYENGKRTAGAGIVFYNGAYYHIDGSAKAQCNVTVWVSKTNGYWPVGSYTFGADGKMIIYDGIANGYYYVEGIKTAAGLIYVDGAYYYAEYGGKLITNQTYWISKNNNLLPLGTYRFDAEGKAVMTTDLVDENGTLYYYLNGKRTANVGMVDINGDYYYIGSGAIAIKNQIFWVTITNGLVVEGNYRFDENGKAVMTTEIANEDGVLYYYENGKRTAGAGIVYYDGAYYHIDGKAKAQCDVTVWVSKTNGYWPVGSYTFGADGKMIIYDGIANGYYYVEGIKTAAGLIYVDGAYYYAGYAGKLITNQSYWISQTNDLLPLGTYRFDAEGKAVMSTDLVDENGTLYYYLNGKRTANVGMIDINGDYYYIGSGAIAVKSQTFWVTITNDLVLQGNYRFDENGKAVMTTEIVSEDGVLYYYENGKRTAGAGIVYYEGAYYHIDGKAKAQCNVTVWVSKTNGYWPVGSYTFGADGKMIIYDGVANGYYYVEGIKTAAGLVYENGYYYYASGGGKLITNQSYWISQTNDLLVAGTYRFDEEGRIDMNTGLSNEDGKLYYYLNGKRTAVGLVEIDGDYYYIGGGAIAVTGQRYWVSNTNGLVEEGYYEFDADGKMIKN